MIEINGVYANAIIYTDEIEASAAGQIRALCDQPFAAGSKIRIMPDVHTGKGCTIGTTMTVGITWSRTWWAWTSAAAWTWSC